MATPRIRRRMLKSRCGGLAGAPGSGPVTNNVGAAIGGGLGFAAGGFVAFLFEFGVHDMAGRHWPALACAGVVFGAACSLGILGGATSWHGLLVVPAVLAAGPVAGIAAWIMPGHSTGDGIAQLVTLMLWILACGTWIARGCRGALGAVLTAISIPAAAGAGLLLTVGERWDPPMWGAAAMTVTASLAVVSSIWALRRL